MSAIERTVAAAERAARAFRLGMEAQGNEAFVAFVDALSGALADPENAPVAEAVAPFLGEIIDAQGRGDLLRVADLLLHELVPRLSPSG